MVIVKLVGCDTLRLSTVLGAVCNWLRQIFSFAYQLPLIAEHLAFKRFISHAFLSALYSNGIVLLCFVDNCSAHIFSYTFLVPDFYIFFNLDMLTNSEILFILTKYGTSSKFVCINNGQFLSFLTVMCVHSLMAASPDSVQDYSRWVI